MSNAERKIVILPEEAAAAAPLRSSFANDEARSTESSAARPAPVGAGSFPRWAGVALAATVLAATVLAGFSAIAFVGSGSSFGGGTRERVLAVLRADEALSRERESLPPDATPAQLVWTIGRYCDAVAALDMSSCPAEFRVAFRHHVGAWREVQAALRRLPNGFLEGFLMGAVNGVLRGERDGGQARLQSELRSALERVRDTWIEVEKIAAEHGAAL